MISFVVHAPSANDILNLNEYICNEDSNPFHCYEIGKVESAIHSAFYPGLAPFVHGGIAKIAGALCFYLVKAHAFMNKHGWDLVYPFNEE